MKILKHLYISYTVFKAFPFSFFPFPSLPKMLGKCKVFFVLQHKTRDIFLPIFSPACRQWDT